MNKPTAGGANRNTTATFRPAEKAGMFGANPVNFMHQEFFTIQNLLHYALNTLGHQGKGIYIGGIVYDELAEKITSLTSLHTAGYRITIDHSTIIHALRQHGQAIEVLRGQLPMTAIDIAQLAGLLLTPNQVADAGRVNGQPRCLRFELHTATARLIASIEVRTGRNRQQLALKTCYKKRPVA